AKTVRITEPEGFVEIEVRAQYTGSLAVDPYPCVRAHEERAGIQDEGGVDRIASCRERNTSGRAQEDHAHMPSKRSSHHRQPLLDVHERPRFAPRCSQPHHAPGCSSTLIQPDWRLSKAW